MIGCGVYLRAAFIRERRLIDSNCLLNFYTNNHLLTFYLYLIISYNYMTTNTCSAVPRKDWRKLRVMSMKSMAKKSLKQNKKNVRGSRESKPEAIE